MLGSLRNFCSPIPAVIAKPPVGSGLRHTCDAIEQSAAAAPATAEACNDAAQRAVQVRAMHRRRQGPRKQTMTHKLQVMRLKVAMLRQLCEANEMPADHQREALAVMLTVRLYMMCGGQSGRPGAHTLACDSVAKAFGPGISTDDVSTLVGKFFDAAGRLGSHDSYMSDRPTFMRQLCATLSAADDFLLGHTAWIGQSNAADEAANFDARH